MASVYMNPLSSSLRLTLPISNAHKDIQKQAVWLFFSSTSHVGRQHTGFAPACLITKASEASWSYSCDSKVSFDRVQILTPDFSGRRPPPPLSHCLTVSLISLISLISFSSLSHLSHLSLLSLSLSLSPLCLSSFRLSSLSSLAGGSGQRATYKGLFTPASKKSAVFFPTSLPSTFPFWSASFRPPLA